MLFLPPLAGKVPKAEGGGTAALLLAFHADGRAPPSALRAASPLRRGSESGSSDFFTTSQNFQARWIATMPLVRLRTSTLPKPARSSMPFRVS
jgi:hypothetical protein